MKIRQVHFLSIGLLLGLVTMSAVYMGQFNQGAIEGGGSLRAAIKALTVLFLITPLIKYRLAVNDTVLALTVIHLVMFFSTLGLMIYPGNATYDSQWLNFHISVLALWVSYDWNSRQVQPEQRFVIPLVLALLASVLLDAYAYATDNVLWENRALIGTFGNPSTFGFICVVALLYTSRLSGMTRYLVGILLVLAAVGSQSLFAILCALAAFIYINRRATLLLLPLVAVLAYKAYDVLSELHFAYKIASAAALFGSGSGESASVYGRLDFYQTILAWISEYPYSLLIGHPGAMPYISGDAGWFSLIVSYGVPLVGVYLFLIIRELRMGGPSARNEVWVAQTTCVLFLFFMLVNRISDYWPIAIIMYWHLGEIIAFKQTGNLLRSNAAGSQYHSDGESAAYTPSVSGDRN